MKLYNFSAGPSILHPTVLEQASKAVYDFEGMGLSLVEISHRSKEFSDVIEQARELALELSGLKGKGYKALFLQGGASTQFLMVAMNLLNKKASYADTGTWSYKAIKEAKMIGEVEVVTSSRADGYKYIPKDIKVSPDSDYLHITTNNTIYGTQYKFIPQVDIPLVADMSSDIFSCDIDYSKFSLIYAGAQKNIGASGATLVLVKEDLLGKVSRSIPSILNYKVHIDGDSMFNTPCTFAIYTCLLSLRWLKSIGGVKAIDPINKDKASMLYRELDNNPYIIPYCNKEDRSDMNVTFNMVSDEYCSKFDSLCRQAGISGIKGHKSVGGYRASIYNAMPVEGVKTLIEVIRAL